MSMNPLAFTRELIDIESITGNETHVGDFLFERLFHLGYNVRRILVEPGRFDVLATPPNRPSPAVVFSSHMDTVPPFIPSSEGEGRIYGRGSCDAKGIIAAQVAAAEQLRADGAAAGLLYLVGEERDNIGAKVANEHSIGCKFLINGEPTDNRLGVATKGALRADIIAQGRMAHSAYPELGESAIEKLLEALVRLREMKLPVDPEFGSSTMNIGVVEGGRAPNVIPDRAKAQLLYRLVGPSSQIREQIVESVGDLAQVEFVLDNRFVKLHTLSSLPSMIASFTTDIPALSNWGQPLLIGPGSIHVAHTEHEYIEKKQLLAAVDIYCDIAKQLTS